MAAVVTACSSPSSRVVVVPGQVVVDGGSTFRTKDHNAIEVTVVRSLEAATGTGIALLHDMDLDTARRSPLVRVAAARAWLEIADRLKTEPHQAYVAARRGVDELGQLYLEKRVLDDTGNYLLGAEDAAQRGNEAGAVITVEKVIRSRIALYVRGYRGLVE